MEVIGIAGGSGVGKSTLSYMLIDQDPARFELINLDDYQKAKTDPSLPRVDGMVNWDHPNAIRWQDIRRDVGLLRSGQEVPIEVWSHRSNPDYATHRQLMPRVLLPKPILIIEGYLALFDELVDIYDKKFYLDLDEETRNQRRRDARGGKDTIIGENQYIEKVLNPMHEQYVEPTKANADFVVGVGDKTPDEVAEFVLQNI